MNPFNPNPSKHLAFKHNPDKEHIYQKHRLKHFANNERLRLEMSLKGGQIIFEPSDEIIIGERTIYWYISRVGEFYTKSNGDLDAEHIGEEFIIKISDAKFWRAVCCQEQCFLELELKTNIVYRSTDLPLHELDNLVSVQRELNSLIGR